MPNLRLVEYKEIEQINNPEGRTYRTETGSVYPSITTVLSKLSEEGIAEWRKKVGEAQANHISGQSSGVGNDLHLSCEQYVLGQTVTNKGTMVNMLFNKMKPFLNKIGDVYGVEIPMWSDYLKLAGTSDCIGYYDGVLSVIDYKNSRKPKKKEWIKNYFLQGAAYSRMFYERYNMLPKQIVIIIGNWDGTVDVHKERVGDYFPELVDTMKIHNPMWQKM